MSPKKQANKGKSLESWIWAATCSIREAKDAPKYKDYILPLIFNWKTTESGHSCPLAPGESSEGGQECSLSVAPLKLHGQEYIADIWAMACMSRIIHAMEGEIEIGDTFKNRKFRDKRGKLRTSLKN